MELEGLVRLVQPDVDNPVLDPEDSAEAVPHHPSVGTGVKFHPTVGDEKIGCHGETTFRGYRDQPKHDSRCRLGIRRARRCR